MKQTDPYVPVTQSAAQAAALDDLREKFKELDALIRTVGTPGRERSLALTALEESAMWATKAVMQRED